MLPNLRRLEPQHNAIPRHPGIEELVGQAIFGAIEHDPDLIAADFDVRHDAVQPANLFPAFANDEIDVRRLIAYHLALQVDMLGKWNLRQGSQDFLDQGTPGVQGLGIHCNNLSSRGSKTSKCKPYLSTTPRPMGS